jgi:hypothetical protein
MSLFFADLLAALHLAFVLYVIVAQILIVIGVCAGWQWVRNPWFRISHLVMIGIVAAESIVDFECPLTTWEEMLRRNAGQEVNAGETFIGRLVGNIMFFDHEKYYQVFNMIYIGFAVLVFTMFVVAPPRFKKRKRVGSAN